MLLRWRCTVCSLVKSCVAIFRSVRPATSSVSTSSSRDECPCASAAPSALTPRAFEDCLHAADLHVCCPGQGRGSRGRGGGPDPDGGSARHRVRDRCRTQTRTLTGHGSDPSPPTGSGDESVGRPTPVDPRLLQADKRVECIGHKILVEPGPARLARPGSARRAACSGKARWRRENDERRLRAGPSPGFSQVSSSAASRRSWS
jgi:hypothetical protein